LRHTCRAPNAVADEKSPPAICAIAVHGVALHVDCAGKALPKPASTLQGRRVHVAVFVEVGSQCRGGAMYVIESAG